MTIALCDFRVESVATATDEQRLPGGLPAAPVATLTGVAAYQGGGQWAALCLELDIATQAESAEAALSALQQAVHDAQALAAERGISPGFPVPKEAHAEFLLSHDPGQGVPVILHFPA
ncbi:MAG: hypothetical protein ACLQT7_08615 [Candidatus Dormibacteria bacterium]